MSLLETYLNGILARVLIEENRQHHIFEYDGKYFSDTSKAAISLTSQKIQ